MQSHDAYNKPMPEPTADTQPYWDGLNNGRLLLQTCSDCGKPRHYPRPVCPHCYSMNHTWREASGTGTIHSWTVSHHAFHPGFKAELPYVLVTVTLDEGVRMQAQLRGAEPDTLKIDMPVKLAYEAATANLTLPVFVLA